MLEPIQWFGFAGVDMFFVISGFVITWTNLNDLGRPAAAPLYVVRRLWRVYPVYWVAWLFSVAVLRAIVPDWPTVLRPDGWRSLLLYVSNPVPDGSAIPQLPPAWSLIWEMTFYAVFTLFLLVPRRCFVPALLCWAATACLQTVHPIALLAPLSSVFLHPLIIEFVLGCLVALAVRRQVRYAEGLSAIAGIVLFSSGALLHRRLGLDPLWRIPSFGAGAALVIAGLALGERRGRWSAPRWLARVGDASYSTFLVHWPTFVLVGIVMPNVFSSPPVRPLWILLLILLMQAAGFLLHRLVEQPLNGLGTKWFSSHRVAAREPIAAPNPTGFERPPAPQSGFFSQSR